MILFTEIQANNNDILLTYFDKNVILEKNYILKKIGGKLWVQQL